MTFARMVAFAHGHSRQFSYVGLAIAAIVLIYLAVNTYFGYVNKKGQQAYNKAYYSLLKTLKTDGDQKGFKESEELFKQVRDNYRGSKVAPLALPELGYLKFREKKYDEAISLYREFFNEASDDTAYQSLARIALAACYEEKKDFDKAIENLRGVIKGSDEHFKEQAMLNLARVYRLSNQTEKSKEILNEFVAEYDSSPFLPMAKAHLQ